mgnify:CR=1 FL=1
MDSIDTREMLFISLVATASGRTTSSDPRSVAMQCKKKKTSEMQEKSNPRNVQRDATLNCFDKSCTSSTSRPSFFNSELQKTQKKHDSRMATTKIHTTAHPTNPGKFRKRTRNLTSFCTFCLKRPVLRAGGFPESVRSGASSSSSLSVLLG